MHDKDIIFDNEKQKIGFVSANCNGDLYKNNVGDMDSYQSKGILCM